VLERSEMNIKNKALLTIEGLTFEDITTPPEKKLSMIYKFAHIARGECKNPHADWVKELDGCYRGLTENGIIGEEQK